MDDHRIIRNLIRRIREAEDALNCYADHLHEAEARCRRDAADLRRQQEVDEAEAYWRWYNRERAIADLEHARCWGDERAERRALANLRRWL